MIPRKIKHLELINLIKNKGMTAEEIASHMGCTVKCIFKYIRELREQRKVYVCDYLQTKGSLCKVYKAGAFRDADKPEPRYRPREVYVKFVPHPDIAAQWLFNPC